MLGGFPLKVEVESVHWEDQNSGYNFLGNILCFTTFSGWALAGNYNFLNFTKNKFVIKIYFANYFALT